MTETNITTGEAAAVSEAPKEKVLANIVRGVMPVALVYQIKFEEKNVEKDAEVAKMYGTTSGKVSDVRKGRNFGYLTDEFVPTKEQKEAAVAWMQKVPGFGDAQQKVIDRLNNTADATPEQAAAFLNSRASSRAKTPKSDAPASETSPGAGKKGKKKGAETAPATAETAGDLLK